MQKLCNGGSTRGTKAVFAGLPPDGYRPAGVMPKIRNVVEIHNPEAKKMGSGRASQVLRVRLSPPNFSGQGQISPLDRLTHPFSCRTSQLSLLSRFSIPLRITALASAQLSFKCSFVPFSCNIYLARRALQSSRSGQVHQHHDKGWRSC
jgi:hypothetical protein